jgi:spermidine synthase
MRFSLRIRETLYRTQTPYQDLLVLDTYEYGRMLVLDGMVMVSDFDEFIYHEMIVHVPMCLHPNPKRVLVVGGGDGGSVREILRHPSVEEVVLCEIDEAVINASRRFFPKLSKDLDNPKVEIIVKDAIEYVRHQTVIASEAKQSPGGVFDVIIIDSSDPVGPATGLFTLPFFQDVFRCLSPDGVVSAQSESPHLHPNRVRSVYSMMKQLFQYAAVYCAPIPTYPTGYWSFTLGSKRDLSLCSVIASEAKQSPLPDWMEARIKNLEPQLQYYNRDIHQSAFFLPNFLRRWLDV